MSGLRDCPLTERDRERRLIDAAVDDARRGRSRLLLIEGPPGIGKTRLVSLVRERASAAGLDALAVRASELEQAFDFGAVRGLLESRVANMADEQRGLVVSGQAHVALRTLGLARAPFRASQSDALQGAFTGLYWLCVALAQEGPLLLAVDDAHWSDEASLGGRWSPKLPRQGTFQDGCRAYLLRCDAA